MADKITSLQEFLANNKDMPRDDEGNVIVNASLRHEEHLLYDDKLIKIARQRLTAISDLQRMGLVHDLGGLGTMLSLIERSGDMTEAQVSMDGATQAQKDRVSFDMIGVPVPVIHKNWDLNMRQLEASRKRGEPLSTTQMGIATRIVADKLEDMVFNGITSLVVDGRTIHGYLTHPDRNTVQLIASWNDVGARDIIGDTLRMLQAAYNDNFYGPFYMYVSKDIWATIQGDYSTEKGDKTYMERILAFADIMAVRPGDSMPAGTVILVQMTDDVVDLAVGQDMVNIEWRSGDNMVINYKVFAAMAIRVKSDMNKRCGVIHGSV